MKISNKEESICAIATPAGVGAIAIIRISGEEAIEICDKFFIAKNKKTLRETPANRVVYGQIMNDSKIIDEVLVSIFRAPHSYTGENAVEISCHGSIYIQQQILTIAVSNGARLAKAGEFTQRAFLNGKLDLSQAEAVADLIASTNEANHRVSINQMRGGVSGEIKKIREKLLNIASLIELELDFSEEDVVFADRQKLFDLASDIKAVANTMANTFSLGNAIKKGIPVAIVGEPNVGKSTLLNVLLNDEKALVSEIAGTTRDAIEDEITIDGVCFRFIDTAGIRNTTDVIENLGIERTFKKIEQAEIVILLTENNADVSKTMLNIAKLQEMNKKLLVVFNKIDKQTIQTNILESNFKTIYISAKYKQNIDELKKALLVLSGFNNQNFNDVIITNVRHYDALKKVVEAFERIIIDIKQNISNDFIVQDLREALYYLGEITGEITSDEILGNIFDKFCIGK